MSTVKDDVSQAVDRLSDELDALSKKIHDNPELAYQEIKACAWLSEFLGKQGFKVEQGVGGVDRSEEHTSELQSHHELVCRLLLEKKKLNRDMTTTVRTIWVATALGVLLSSWSPPSLLAQA